MISPSIHPSTHLPICPVHLSTRQSTRRSIHSSAFSLRCRGGHWWPLGRKRAILSSDGLPGYRRGCNLLAALPRRVLHGCRREKQGNGVQLAGELHIVPDAHASAFVSPSVWRQWRRGPFGCSRVRVCGDADDGVNEHDNKTTPTPPPTTTQPLWHHHHQHRPRTNKTIRRSTPSKSCKSRLIFHYSNNYKFIYLPCGA